VAAVVLEPMQGEGGMRLPPRGYLAEVARLCQRYGTLLVLDEVQTGLGRTGKMFACEHEGVVPDVIAVAKGLSGGLVPVGAYMTTRRLWERAYGSLDRYDAHSATFTGGPLACAAGIATLEVIARDRLIDRAATLGEALGSGLKRAAAGHALVKEVRGRGLLWGVELRSPGGDATASVVGQWLAVGMMERGMVTQVCTQAAEVVRAEPPLVVENAHIDRFCATFAETLAQHSTGVISSFAGAVKRIAAQRAASLWGGQP
jgi:putrescine aminotransferase